MTESVVFHKMHGIGNDFVVIDRRRNPVNFSTSQIRYLAHRHKGIGFDQMILIDESNDDSCDASYSFFNPDGSQAEQCGNGQRCISYYLHSLNPEKKFFCVDGLAGKITSLINEDKTVAVNMGKMNSCKSITIDNSKLYEANFGNPHLILAVDDVGKSDLPELQKKFTQDYSQGINFEIVEILNNHEIKLRVHERGTGETLACGSGACAAFYALFMANQLNNKVKVMLSGGDLVVEYDASTQTINLTGSATHVFTGEINL